MVNRPKNQGTRTESWLVKLFNERSYPARRLAEGGSDDEGDVEVFFGETRVVVEAKARQVLNVQLTLGKARKKAKGFPVMVAWKRLVKATPDAKRRSPVEGEAVVFVMSPDDFFSFLSNSYWDGYKAAFSKTLGDTDGHEAH